MNHSKSRKSVLVILYPHTKYYEGSLLEYISKGLEGATEENIKCSYLDLTNRPKYQYGSLTDKIKNIVHRVFLNDKQYILTLENDFYNQFYLKKLKEFKKENQKTFDYVLIIKPEDYNPKFIKEVSELGKVTCGYIWDGLRGFLKNDLLKSKKYIKQLYSFDFKDILNHKDLDLKFCTNFFVKDISLNNINYSDKLLDIFYVGNIISKDENKRRDKKILNLLKNIKGGGGNFKIIINPQGIGSDAYLKNPIITYQKEHLSFFEGLRLTNNAKIVLDLCRGHNGLSFRFFDCLLTKTKIITDNKDVISYDFYHPDNILITDFDKPIDADIYNNFISKPYQDLPLDIVEKYSIENWFKYIFDIDGHTPINRVK